MDTFARALLIADDLMQNSAFESMRKSRYASFDEGQGARFEKGELTLEQLAEIGNSNGEPAQTSGRQELYESLINIHIK
jgi:xylose isomerase